MKRNEATDFLDTLSISQQPDDARSFASLLVKAKYLTDYQAVELLEGRCNLIINGLIVHKSLGAGGMGMVYMAWQPTMRRFVAIKFSKQDNAEIARRFEREIEISGELESDYVALSYDTGVHEKSRYLVSAYIEGGDLSELLKSYGPMPAVAAIECVTQVCLGLIYAHHRDIIHRDLKPANILWDAHRERAVISDWGLAKRGKHHEAFIGGGFSEPQVGAHTVGYVGTRAFSPPEQESAASVDERADIYSLGQTLFCLLAGTQVPANSGVIHFGRGDFVDGLNEIYRGMVERELEYRYQTVKEVLDDLRALQPSPNVGLAALRRWLAATASTKPVSQPRKSETFSKQNQSVKTFGNSLIPVEDERQRAKDRILNTLSEAENWERPAIRPELRASSLEAEVPMLIGPQDSSLSTWNGAQGLNEEKNR